MYFDRLWRGIPNEIWASFYISKETGLHIDRLLDNHVFAGYDCTVTYPIAGAFTSFLIQKNGIEPYLALYQYKGRDYDKEFQRIYHTSICQLEEAFHESLKRVSFDAQTLEEMLAGEGL